MSCVDADHGHLADAGEALPGCQSGHELRWLAVKTDFGANMCNVWGSLMADIVLRFALLLKRGAIDAGNAL